MCGGSWSFRLYGGLPRGVAVLCDRRPMLSCICTLARRIPSRPSNLTFVAVPHSKRKHLLQHISSISISTKIRCWKLTQRKMKWRLAMRVATSPKERWLTKAAEWNPELSSKYKTNRSIGRPRKRWEDDINEFLKQIEDETENLTESSNHINKNWINTAKDSGRWTRLEENYTKNSVTRTRKNPHNRPARYVNGVKLNDEEIADITQHNGRISE